MASARFQSVGNVGNAGNAGPFYANGNNALSSANWNIGSRLSDRHSWQHSHVYHARVHDVRETFDARACKKVRELLGMVRAWRLSRCETEAWSRPHDRTRPKDYV